MRSGWGQPPLLAADPRQAVLQFGGGLRRMPEREGAWYSVVLKEGRKRQIRLMLTAVGRVVRSIQRVRIHNLRLGRLPEGQVGELSRKEVRRLSEVLDRGTGESKSDGGLRVSPPSQSSPIKGEEDKKEKE